MSRPNAHPLLRGIALGGLALVFAATVILWQEVAKAAPNSEVKTGPKLAHASIRAPGQVSRSNATKAKPAQPDVANAPKAKAEPVQPKASKAKAEPVQPKAKPGGVMAREIGLVVPAEEQEALPPPELQSLPERDAVAAILGSIRDAVQHCYDTTLLPGRVNLLITVAGKSGQVVRASADAPKRLANCIETIAAELSFPCFSQAEATIRYAYLFR